ncbi:MarR family winged helix-turn-helix transcriptional regulator [Collinsella intestinalis]|uniref:MarR family winged helix-turn-helix transcriptional regulator n=1 Tax=Collinsella intestinalis TaxID=147207 RepID=UPI0019574BC6|nr:MarR family transcriptional regulator [Collinsella intestinalis]MBM6907265.1 MarR family transcriptional regulator [Collinsella intestinalis]
MQDFASEISRTRALVNQFLTGELARRGYAGLAPSHGDILAQLCSEDRVRMSELSRRIDRDPSTVTALVRKLVKLGFAETARDETDGRATVVSLTDRGRALERDFGEISVLLRATWADGISEADLATAARVLAAMRRNLHAAIERGAPVQGAAPDRDVDAA